VFWGFFSELLEKTATQKELLVEEKVNLEEIPR
jgi:hypothetical protein